MSTTDTLLAIQREVDVYIAMAQGRSVATRLNFNDIDRTKIEIMILELARNILNHAGGAGDIRITVVTEQAQQGILIVARDDGPGIPDIERALQDGYSTAGTLGAGLPGVQRLADSFSIESAPGHGTIVKAWKWQSTTTRGKRWN